MSALKRMLDKYRGLDKVALRAGIMGKKTYPDGELVATVGYYNEYGTDVIPARPFFRSAIEKNRQVLPQMAASLLRQNDTETTLRLIGEHMVGELSDSVQTWAEPPNAESTVKQKGYNAPLRANDKLLRNSFSYEIEK